LKRIVNPDPRSRRDGLLKRGESTRFGAMLSGIRHEDRANELVSLKAVGDLEYVGKQPGLVDVRCHRRVDQAPVA